MTSQLGKERAIVSPNMVSNWFEKFQTYVNNKDPTLFQDPSRIYNADESDFSLCPKLSKVLSPVGTSTVYSFTNKQ